MSNASRPCGIVPARRGRLTPEYAVKERLTALRRLLLFYSAERKCPFPYPLARKLKAWRAGFQCLSYSACQLAKGDPRLYLKDFADMNYLLRNPDARAINNKLLFAQSMERIGIPTPRVLAYLDSRKVLLLAHDPVLSADRLPIETLLKEEKCLVFKPVQGSGGQGIFFLRKTQGLTLINNRPFGLPEIERLVESLQSYLVTAFARQAAYAERIYPQATNTIRILTMWDSSENRPFIAVASHRIGSGRSFPVDNFHAGAGGLAARIDLESGRLGPGGELAKNGEVCWHQQHPESGEPIAGVTVPHWEEVKRLVLKAATQVPCAPYLG